MQELSLIQLIVNYYPDGRYLNLLAQSRLGDVIQIRHEVLLAQTQRSSQFSFSLPIVSPASGILGLDAMHINAPTYRFKQKEAARPERNKQSSLTSPSVSSGRARLYK